MWWLNRLLSSLFDLVMRPCQGESPWPGLIVCSFLTAVVLVALFSVTSNQKAIRRTRNRMLARTLELLMFQHDLRVSISACGRILMANAAYLYQMFKPMLVGLIPLVLIVVQMENWFEYRPFHLGESGVLTVVLEPKTTVKTMAAKITTSDNFKIDSPAVHAPQKNEVAWRFVASAPGEGWADISINGTTERKTLVTGDSVARISPTRVQSGMWNEIFSPSEPPLAEASPIRKIEVSYPTRHTSIDLTELHWIWIAVVFMMAFSLALGQMFGITVA